MGLAVTFPKLNTIWRGDKIIESLQAKCTWLEEEKDVMQPLPPKKTPQATINALQRAKAQRAAYQQWITQCVKALSAEGIRWNLRNRATRWPFLTLSHGSILFYVKCFLPDIIAHAHRHLPHRLAALAASENKRSRTLEAAEQRVNTFQEAARYVHWALTEAMLQRLEAWQASDFVHANPLVIAAQALPRAADHSPYDSQVLELYLSPLTAEQRHVFETFVEQQGNERQRARLNQLFWRNKSYGQSHPYFPLTTRGRGKQQFLIPAQFHRWVPRFRLWPNWLFKGHNFRYDFFKTRRHLLIQCLGLVEGQEVARQGPLSSVAAKHWAKRLQRLQQQLATATKTLHMPRKPRHDWRGIYRFKARWYEALQGMQSKLTYTRLVVAQQTARSTEESLNKEKTPNLSALEVAKALLANESTPSSMPQQAPPITPKTLTTRVYQALDKKISPNGHHHDGRFRYLLLRLSKAQHLSPQETVFFCQYVTQWQRINPHQLNAILKERPAVINGLWPVMLNQLTQGPASPVDYEQLVVWERPIRAFTALVSTEAMAPPDNVALMIRLSLKPFLLSLAKADLAKSSQRTRHRRWLKTLLPLVLPQLKEEHLFAQRLMGLNQSLKSTASPSHDGLGHDALTALNTCFSHSLMGLQFKHDMQRLQQAIDTHWRATTPLMKTHIITLKQVASQAKQYPLTVSKSLTRLIKAEIEQHPSFRDWLELQVIIAVLPHQGIGPLLQQADESVRLVKRLAPILESLTLPLVQFDDRLLTVEDIDWGAKAIEPPLNPTITLPNPGVLNPCHS